MRKKTVLVFINMLLGIIIAISIIEVFFNLFPNLYPQSLGFYKLVGTRDEYLGHKLKPDINYFFKNNENQIYEVKTTSLGFSDIGFRDDGIVSQLPFAIAVGDSFTFGLGLNISDTWTKILEKRLNKNVVNMGIYASSTIQQQRIIEKYGIKLRPKVVLLQFYGRNDFVENYEFVKNQNNQFIYRLKLFLDDNSFTYKLLMYYFIANNQNLIYHKNGGLDNVYNLDLSFALRNLTENKEGYKLTKNALSDIKKIVETNGAELIVIFFPSKEEVYWHTLRKIVNNSEQFDISYPTEEIKQFCQDNGIDYIDLTPVFKQHTLNNDRLYLVHDPHFNSAGHRLAADEVYEYLIKNKII